MTNNKICSTDIINGIEAGIAIIDSNFRIVWVNKYQAGLFGNPEIICGKHCYNIFEHREHLCRGCPTLKVFKTGNVHTANRIGCLKSGEKRHYKLTVSPIKDNNNKVKYAVELVQDINDKVLQERGNIKIINRLKKLNERFASVNNRLRQNVSRLKAVTKNVSGNKRKLENKYHEKVSELLVLKEELQDIFKINRTLTSTVDIKKITSLVTKLSCELIRTEVCMLWFVDEHKKIMTVRAAHGLNSSLNGKIPILKIGESLSGKVALTKKPAQVYDIDKDPRVKYKDLLKKEGAKSIIAVPMVYQNKVLGVITLYSRKSRNFSNEEIKALSIFASQAAIAMQESRYCEDIHVNYFNTMHTLVLAIEARDPYTRGHTERVTKYAMEVARVLKMHETELETLRYAAEVHDIGKISIPDFILNKPGRLTPAERAMIELHPVKGAEILDPLDFLRPAIPIVRHHHERFDGTGYPDGLGRDRIPLMSRILACADSFDAMTSERPYRRRKLSIDEALTEIKNNSGSQFDPHIAQLFIKTIQTQAPLKKKAFA